MHLNIDSSYLTGTNVEKISNHIKSEILATSNVAININNEGMLCQKQRAE